MLCLRCGGTGEYRGQGMMMKDCELCTSLPVKPIKEPPIDSIDKKSPEYKTAIKQIMALNKDLTKADAVKLFEKTYVQIR
ncbi:MAG TPA: hypothetical protein VHZ76_03280 [Gammaproteobacteria bacterium]|jgi:hypothetical protein|nr:hypothetical protein [Gammaproteobacteria bacterium]